MPFKLLYLIGAVINYNIQHIEQKGNLVKVLLAVFTLITLLNSAAPDDISTSQRAWYDAVDLDADNNYTNNPNNNSFIQDWSDKSVNNNDLSAPANVSRPRYRQNSISAERHGVDYDGANDSLRRATDIYTGTPIRIAEIYIVAATDRIENHFLFSSNSALQTNSRISAHTPWGNNRTYFDHGTCCGNPARLSGVFSITIAQQYIWNFIANTTSQQVLRDGRIQLSDGGAGPYVNINSSFALGNFATSTNLAFNGRIFEAIFYQATLNSAQKNILNNYLSSKWDKSFQNISTYIDIYNGDTSANGKYDFFVAGIGEESDGIQSVATSQGITITNNTFLSNGKYMTVGVNYLTTTPPTSVTSSDLAISSNYTDRASRTWYIDTTGTDGLVNLEFNASTIGLDIENGETYGLLYRSGTTGNFSEVSTAVMSDGKINFSYLPSDGVYTVGKKREVILTLSKTNQTIWDNVNNEDNAKAIPGAYIDYTLIIKNLGDKSPDTGTVTIRDTLPENLSLFVGNLNSTGTPFIFSDNNCSPETSTMNSGLSLDYPSDVTFKNDSNITISPSPDFDDDVKSFEIQFSGIMNARTTTGPIPCFTLIYRTQVK
ncbi:MAG: Unknown protein [uncultured Campylobacterales bacterium]|uniref:DUF11 domain-containing protein n=1 Tax=uncultured Campylobacterales bacterium TaxID=352960 RepID=A0A6S6SF56_9BACT|nr:MAG: Unknown protein [uncultured Campylobacterales bacterium]